MAALGQTMMKQLFFIACFSWTYLLFAGCPGVLDFQSQLELRNSYVWRGILMHKAPSTALTVASHIRDTRFVAWADFDKLNRRPFELDFALEGYQALSMDWVLEAGLSRMTFREQKPQHEAYLTLRSEKTWAPHMSAFLNLENKGLYTNIWVSREFQPSSKTWISMEAGLGAVHRQPQLGLDASGQAFTGLHDGRLKITFNTITDALWNQTLVPSLFVEYHLPLGTRSRHCLSNLNDGKATLWQVGLRLCFTRSFGSPIVYE